MATVENTRDSLLTFIKGCTSPFHVVNKSQSFLIDKGFEELSLNEKWHLREGQAYVVNAFGSTCIAFRIGNDMRDHMRIASAHTDFPSIRIKPNPIVTDHVYELFNVEMYGGLQMHTWLDRPLSIAGKVALVSDDPFQPKVDYVDFKDPLLTIPSLAIHMNRKANEGYELNKQNHMRPLTSGAHAYLKKENDLLEETEARQALTRLEEDLHAIDFTDRLSRLIGCHSKDILFFELGLYPTEPGCTLGFNKEFISSPRLDNVTSVKACLEGIAHDRLGKGLHIIALFDNEEIGSRTKQGAASLLLQQVICRIYMAMGYSMEAAYEDIIGGFMISADVAHGYHPNYSNTCDITNKSLLNGGLAIKYAAMQTYAGDAEAVAIVKALCHSQNIPYQIYVNRSDIPGGSTLGSIASAMLPMRTMDVGVPILAMHSIRELMGENDQKALEDLLICFFNYTH